MCNILSLKREKEDIVVELKMTEDEFQKLKGNVSNIYMFSENTAKIMTNISGRGKNSATKYFLIPTLLRKNLNLSSSSVACEKIETKEKMIFVYLVDKWSNHGSSTNYFNHTT